VASTGVKNWNKNWRGQNHPTRVKKLVSFFIKDDNGNFRQGGSLSPGTSVTYIDSESESHLKAAFQVPGQQQVVYANVDFFSKPGRSDVRLSPASFGLAEQTFGSSALYYTALQNAINSRSDISGELFDYLYELLDYAKNGAGNYSGIDFTGFPWSEIQNYYAETIGPLAAINRGILTPFISGGAMSASIYIPPQSEGLYDYALRVGNNEYKISAKSARGISNQVKPQFVTPVVEASGKLGTLANSKAFQLLKILGSNSVVNGAFLGWQYLQTDNSLSSAAVNSVISKRFDPLSFYTFIEKYMPEKKSRPESVTLGELRYKCEQLIENWSKSGLPNQNLRSIFNIYMNESRIIYVKMSVNNTTGTASFTADAGGGSRIVNRLYLRTSNYATRTEDRIGFQIS
jgi:hypothetical protein